MSNNHNEHNINFFSPRGSTMRREVRVIMLVLASWLVAIVGFQLLVLMLQTNFSSLLNSLTFFNLPIHYWLTGQLLPLWFVLLCIAFNLWMDRHTPKDREGSLRFHIPSSKQQNKTGE